MGFDEFQLAFFISAAYAISQEEGEKATLQAFKAFVHGWAANRTGFDGILDANSFALAHPEHKHARRDWLAGYAARGVWLLGVKV